MRKSTVFFALLIVFLLVKPSYADPWTDWGIESLKSTLPEMWITGFNDNTRIMGENYPSFTEAFKQLDSMDKKKAGVFLVAFMPLVDLAAMDTQTFVNNINYAFQARQEFPWCKEYDDEFFYHYVLPHRVSQEPIEDFRPFFYNELKDRLKGLKTLDQAAVAVNKYCDERVEFKTTQWRDQGPFETLKSGYGRCEEMMIFYIDAARSMGIPARQAWTPYWAHCDNNHAWTEVYAFGRWNFLGACEYADKLDEAWFKNPAKQAAMVMSVPFGLPDRDKTSEEIYKYVFEEPDRYAIINSTSFYTKPGKLVATLVDENDQPVADAKVYVYVFNFGALRPIAMVKTSEMGIARITLGEGRYFVSGGIERAGAGKLVNIKKQQDNNVTLKIGDGDGLKEFNWVRPSKKEQ
jgi:hypothetical protein